MQMQGTFSKLKDGSWGARIQTTARPAPGEKVTLTRKDAGTVTKEVVRVLFFQSGVALCTIQDPSDATKPPGVKPSPVGKPTRTPRAPRGWRPCGYPGCGPGYCDECDGAGA